MNRSKGRGLNWRTRKEADGKTQTGRLRADQGPRSRAPGAQGCGAVVGCEVREAGELKVLPLSASVAQRSQWGSHKQDDPRRERCMGDAWNTDPRSLA